MSCETGPNKIARLAGQVSGGISQAAGKAAYYAGVAAGSKTFYAGAAIGAGGAVGGLALARMIRQRRTRKSLQPRRLIQGGSNGPGTKTNPRQIPVKSSGGSNGPGTKTNPRQIPVKSSGRSSGPGIKATPRQIPVLPKSPVETRLKAASIQVQSGAGQPHTLKNSYQVLRSDGSDTGLAITPYLRDEGGQLVEDQEKWGVTHAGSGSLISGPYNNISQAQGLAAQLADLNWTAAQVPPGDVARARQIVSNYQHGGKGDNSV